MQNNTKRKKKIVPVIITVIVVLYMASLIFISLGLLGILSLDTDAAVALPFLLIYALVGLAVIIGIIIALHQRMKEIDSGEEEEAQKY